LTAKANVRVPGLTWGLRVLLVDNIEREERGAGEARRCQRVRSLAEGMMRVRLDVAHKIVDFDTLGNTQP